MVVVNAFNKLITLIPYVFVKFLKNIKCFRNYDDNSIRKFQVYPALMKAGLFGTKTGVQYS